MIRQNDYSHSSYWYIQPHWDRYRRRKDNRPFFRIMVWSGFDSRFSVSVSGYLTQEKARRAAEHWFGP